MSDKPPFDPLRVAVYLVAFVIVSHILIASATAGMCFFHADAIVMGRFKCDADNRAFDLLGNALSAALAFCGGFLAGKIKPP